MSRYEQMADGCPYGTSARMSLNTMPSARVSLNTMPAARVSLNTAPSAPSPHGSISIQLGSNADNAQNNYIDPCAVVMQPVQAAVPIHNDYVSVEYAGSGFPTLMPIELDSATMTQETYAQHINQLNSIIGGGPVNPAFVGLCVMALVLPLFLVAIGGVKPGFLAGAAAAFFVCIAVAAVVKEADRRKRMRRADEYLANLRPSGIRMELQSREEFVGFTTEMHNGRETIRRDTKRRLFLVIHKGNTAP